jgi:hypothetical protein
MKKQLSSIHSQVVNQFNGSTKMDQLLTGKPKGEK